MPVLTGLVWLLARLGIGDPAVSFMRLLRLTTVFAGAAALFTAGGIGRLSAYASIDGGRRRAMTVAARAHAAASVGLLVIAAIPHGQLPAPVGWLAYVAGGLIGGAGCGALIGLVAGGTAPVELADVWQLARKPGEALKSWLDPSELVRLGAAMRHRTTNLFEGMFDPQAPAPAPSEDEATEATAAPEAKPEPQPAPEPQPPGPPTGGKDAP